jgi:pimeloyl-ACP methyl ester carboxylesterase
MIATEPSLRDPFHTLGEVSVRGGTLRVARAGPPPPEADAVVLAVHGVTGSHMAFRTVARELVGRTGLCVLAPDLRGRGQSAALPGPYGHAINVTDLLAVLDDAGVERAVLAGHSSGAYAVALLAAEHPERAAAVVLLDGGLSFPVPPGQDDVFEQAVEQVVEQWVSRLRPTYASVDQYVGLWRAHPALRNEWNDDVEAYARYDLAGEPGAMRSVIPEDVVVAECRDVIFDKTVRTAVHRVRPPLHLVLAPRGLLDADPVLPRPVVDAFAAAHPDARVEEIPDINHYGLVLGATGPRRVAAVIEEAARHTIRT